MAPAPNQQRMNSGSNPCHSNPRNHRNSKEQTAASSKTRQPQRAASFHGRTATEPAERRLIWRPKTHPDLLTERRKGGRFSEGASDSNNKKTMNSSGEVRKMPTKVLVNVTVQQCMWPVQVMASTEWSVADLVAATLRLYVKEGRRPLLPTTEPSAFGLHYSQFSLESLDAKEKLMGLGSRNFFLCPKPERNPTPAFDAAVTSASPSSSSSSAASCSKEAIIGIPWLRFMEFFL